MSSSADAVRTPAGTRRAWGPARALAAARRWTAAHEHVTAAIGCALFVLAYLWPVLIGGKTLSPTTVLYQFAPWTSTVPPDVAQYSNMLLSDIIGAHYPWNVLARDAIHSGTFPAWSQHAFAGTPFYANPQTVLLSPFSIPLWVLPLNYALGLIAALKLWVGSFGMYLLVRELRLGFWPGLLAGVCYALSAFNLVWLTHETLPAVAALLPWLILLVERTIRTGRPGAALWLAPATAVMITGGHPGTAVHVALATGLYALVRAALAGRLTLSQRVRRLVLALGGLALGGLLIAVLVIPTMRAGTGTIGQEARTGGEGTMPGVTMSFDAIRSAIFPDWWGRPSNGEVAGPANYNERTFYAGGVAALFALVALLAPNAWRRKAAFVLIGALGLAVPLHAPVVHWLASNLPVIETVQNQRMLLLFCFAVPVLGAFGLQRLLDLGRPDLRAWAALGLGVVIAGLGLLSASGADLGDAVSNATSGITHVEPKTLILSSVVWWAVLVAGFAAALVLWWRRPRWRLGIAAIVIALAVVDMLHFAGDYQPMAPASKSIPPRTGAVDYLVAHRDDGRIVGVANAMTQNWAAIYGLHDVRGYDPPQPSLAYYHLWQVLSPGQPNWTPFGVGGFEEGGLNVLSVLGARYIAGPPGMEPERGSPVNLGYRGNDANVLVNPEAVPRAMVPEQVDVATDADSVPGLVAEASFRPRREVIVERGAPGAEELTAVRGPNGSARVVGESNSTVTLNATLRRRGLVVLNDAIAPGWTVKVDGESRPPITVNGVMRGVVVEPGRHEVRWSYRVPGLRLGAALSVLALAVLIAGVVLVRRRPFVA